jgi:hypothetical protein
LCLLLAALSVLALVAGGIALGWSRLDSRATERELRRFVSRVMTHVHAGRWSEVRGVASRDAFDALERQGSQPSPARALEARNLGSGRWALYVESRSGERYRLELDELSWRLPAWPWRPRHFRMSSLERI